MCSAPSSAQISPGDLLFLVLLFRIVQFPEDSRLGDFLPVPWLLWSHRMTNRSPSGCSGMASESSSVPWVPEDLVCLRKPVQDLLGLELK